MSKYFGDIVEDSTIEIPFNTYNADGASVTFTGTTVKVYKDSATGTEVTTGVTLSKDHDGIVGSHLITIVTTDAFYATGSNYFVQLQAATIATQTVNSFIGSFSIQNRYMVGTNGANTITPLTDQETRDSMLLAPGALPPQVASIDTQLTDIKAEVNGLDGDAMRGTDDAATEAKQDAGDTVRDRISDIQESDKIIDFPNGTLTYKEKGTANVLLTKDLKDPDGVAVNSTEDVIAEEENV